MKISKSTFHYQWGHATKPNLNHVCELDANGRMPGARYRREAADGLMGLGSNLKCSSRNTADVMCS